MRIVEQATINPARCAVLPCVGGTRGPFVDTGSELPGKGDQWDLRVYVSFIAINEMCRLIGGGSPEDIAALNDRIAQLELERDEAREELARTELVLDSIDVLEGADFRARRKTGRPKIKQEATA